MSYVEQGALSIITLQKEVIEFLKRRKTEFFMKNSIHYSFLLHFRSPILPYSHPP